MNKSASLRQYSTGNTRSVIKSNVDFFQNQDDPWRRVAPDYHFWAANSNTGNGSVGPRLRRTRTSLWQSQSRTDGCRRTAAKSTRAVAMSAARRSERVSGLHPTVPGLAPFPCSSQTVETTSAVTATSMSSMLPPPCHAPDDAGRHGRALLAHAVTGGGFWTSIVSGGSADRTLGWLRIRSLEIKVIHFPRILL